MNYQFNNNYTVVEADPKEFATYYVIYGHGNKNIWFPTKMENVINMFSKIERHYWISYDGLRIGGFIMNKNWFGFIFLIPPFNNEYEILSGIVNLIYELTDQSVIKASGIYPQSYHNFQRLGFQITETERIMIKPTAQYYVNWDNEFILDIPKKENKTQLVDLYYDVYKKSTVPCMANQTYEFYQELLEAQIPMVESKYSTLLYDKCSHQLIASCLVIMWEELPYIADIVVKDKYKGKGLGTMMIKKALNNAYGKHPALRLATRAGNRAEGLYHRLGFVNGVESSELKLVL